VTTPGPARWPVRLGRVFRVLIVLMLAFAGWVSCAGTEVWTRIDPVDDASLAGIWAGPHEAGLILGSDGELHASHLPAAAFGGEGIPQLDRVDARWTRERRALPPDAIRVRFADPSATELLFDVRRSWRGRPVLILWTSRCLSCRQVPVTFARRS
jgi:hypothetical protein